MSGRTRTNSSAVRDRIYAVIAKSQRLSVESVRSAESLNDLHIDSLDALNIIFSLEEEFKISIKMDVNRITTPEDFLKMVERRIVG